MKMMLIPIAIITFETVSKSFERGLKKLEIRRRIESMKTTALFRSTRILRKVLESRGYMLSLTLK